MIFIIFYFYSSLDGTKGWPFIQNAGKRVTIAVHEDKLFSVPITSKSSWREFSSMAYGIQEKIYLNNCDSHKTDPKM